MTAYYGEVLTPLALDCDIKDEAYWLPKAARRRKSRAGKEQVRKTKSKKKKKKSRNDDTDSSSSADEVNFVGSTGVEARMDQRHWLDHPRPGSTTKLLPHVFPRSHAPALEDQKGSRKAFSPTWVSLFAVAKRSKNPAGKPIFPHRCSSATA